MIAQPYEYWDHDSLVVNQWRLSSSGLGGYDLPGSRALPSTLWPTPVIVTSTRPSCAAVVDDRATKSVLEALEDPKFDFRTPAAIARATGLSQETVLTTVRGLKDQVRPPLCARPDERHLYRLTARGYTRGEKVRRFLATVSRG